MIYGCKEGHQLSCRDYPNCEGCNAFVDVRTQASTGIEIVPDYKNQWRTQETDVSEVLRTLEKLYNDFTMRKEEEQALDFAIKFIKAHQKDGLDKMIADCERHLTCKGCQHEKECE